MPSNYPASLDAFPTSRTDATPNTTTQAADHNNYADAINKIEAELGTLPKGLYSDVKSRLDALEYLTGNTQSGTGYTLALADASRVVSMTNAAANVVTVPPHASVSFPVGARIVIRQSGAGTTRIAPGDAVTIVSVGGERAINAPFGRVTLVQTATDTWELFGDLVGWTPTPPSTYKDTGSFSTEAIVDTIAGTNPEYALFYSDRQHAVLVPGAGVFVAYNYTDSNHNPAHWRLKRSVSKTSGEYDCNTWTTVYTESTLISGGGGPGIEADEAGNVYVVVSNYNDPTSAVFRVYKFSPADNYTTPTVASYGSVPASNKFTCTYDPTRDLIWISTWQRQNAGEIDLFAVDSTLAIRVQRQVMIDWGSVTTTAYAKADYTALTVARDGTLFLSWHSDANVTGTKTLNGAHNSYYSVNFVYSRDAGATWFGPNGRLQTLIYPEQTSAPAGGMPYTVVDTTAGVEFIPGTDGNYFPNGTAKYNWNTQGCAPIFNDDALHFYYNGSSVAAVVGTDHHPYARFDWRSKTIDKRLQPLAATSGTTTALDGTVGGGYVQDTSQAGRIYFVGNGAGADYGKIVVLKSDDNGLTWTRYAASSAIGNNPIYTGAAKFTQTDGSIIAYTVQATTPFRLYVFRITPN